MNVESMLEPVSPSALCGEDVTYDDVMAGGIDPLLDPGYEYQAADAAGPPKQKPIDWREIHRLSLGLFEKGKHLRLAVLLTESGMELTGAPGLRDGLALLEGLCSRYWEEVYPNEAGYLAQERSLLMNGLTDSRFVKRVARMPLASSRMTGQFSYDDFQKASAAAREDAEAANQERLIRGVFEKEIGADTHQESIATLEQCIASIDTVGAVFDDRLGANNHQVNFRELKKQLQDMIKFLQPFAHPEAPVESSGEVDEAGNVVSTGAPAVPGTVNSRESAIAAMDRVIDYFQRAEPSSPVPFLLRRAQRCIGLNFLDLVDELTQSRAAFESLLLGANHSE